MRYLEVRKLGNRIIKINDGEELVYEGDIPFLDVLEEIEEGFYRPKFTSKHVYEEEDFLSFQEFIKAGFEGKFPPKLKWILKDSCHRDDVRIVTEDFYKEIFGEGSKFVVCTNWQQMEEEFDPLEGYIKATTAIHQAGDISREKPEYAHIVGEDEENYYGAWLEGLGFLNVRFPKSSSEFLTGEALVLAEEFSNNCRIGAL